MSLFKRKKVIPEKPKKMDLSMYKMELSVKAICMYERMSGKSFFKFDEDEVLRLLYCTFMASNKEQITYEMFLTMMENAEIAKWASKKYTSILEVVKQFSKEGEKTEEKGEEEEQTLTITDLASSLIIDYHMDAHYVMYEMDIWEVEALYRACDSKVKRRYEEERLWAYINILPQVDSKKLKGPSDLLPFPWEKEEKKKKTERDMKNNEYAVKHTIGMKIEDILHGKTRHDN